MLWANINMSGEWISPLNRSTAQPLNRSTAHINGTRWKLRKIKQLTYDISSSGIVNLNSAVEWKKIDPWGLRRAGTQLSRMCTDWKKIAEIMDTGFIKELETVTKPIYRIWFKRNLHIFLSVFARDNCNTCSWCSGLKVSRELFNITQH